MEQTVADMTAANPNVKSRIVPLDLKQAKTEDYAHLLDAGKHTIVVNNAGIIDRQKFFEVPLEKIEDLIKTNVHPYVLLSKYATLHFREHKDSHYHKNALIHVSSIVADTVIPFHFTYSTYGATKAFNLAFAH
jgi:short-subunit dehydrogenase